MRRIAPFEVFSAGSECFIAGIALTLALRAGPWTRSDLASLIAAVVLVMDGGARLRAIYLATRSDGRSDPALQGPNVANGERGGIARV